MSHFSFCKMSQCRPTFFHSQTAHKYAAKKGLFWHTETIVQYCKPACSMMAATVKRLRLGWTLWPASLMLNPWLRTWSTTVARISFEITILLLLLSLVLILLILLLFLSLLLPLVLLLLLLLLLSVLCLLFPSLLLLVLLFLLLLLLSVLCLLFLSLLLSPLLLLSPPLLSSPLL